MQVTIYILPVPENEEKDIPVDNKPTSKFSQAQETDESLKHVHRWVKQKIIPTHEIQGLPRLGWQIYNQLDSLYIQDGILCCEFDPRMVV